MTIPKSSLWRSWACAALNSLLFTFCWPCWKHGWVNRKGSLSEILMLQTIFSSDSSAWIVCQEPENYSKGWSGTGFKKKKKQRKGEKLAQRGKKYADIQFKIFPFSEKGLFLKVNKNWNFTLNYFSGVPTSYTLSTTKVKNNPF